MNEKKNEILIEISHALIMHREEIIEANKRDLDQAEANGVPAHMLDRLMLDNKRIHDIADALLHVMGLKDPVGSGEVFTTPGGLEITCERVPIGVVAIIPILGWIVSIVGGIITFILMILGIINAGSGKAKQLPIIGKYTLIK